MSQTEIPRESWKPFCDDFTRQHQFWIINISEGDKIPDDQKTAGSSGDSPRALYQMIALHSISADGSDGDYKISIVAGTPPNQVTHVIYNPARLFFNQNNEGAHEGVAIEHESGEITLMRFRAAALPETLDGITEAELLIAM